MKALTFPTLLGTLALLLASCDKPKVAAPPPPPGSDGKFANGGATGLVARIRALSVAVQEAQNAGDTSKNEQFMARAMTLLTEARSHAASVTRAEVPQFAAQLTEYLKPLGELAATATPEIAARFATDFKNTNDILANMNVDYAALSSTSLAALAPPPDSSKRPPMKSYSGAPKGSGKFDSSQKYETPSASTEPSRPPPETPASPATPAPEAPATPAVPAVPEIK